MWRHPFGKATRLQRRAGLRGGDVHVGGTGGTRQPIDLLFGARAGPGNARAQILTFGGRFRIEGFTARYEALMLDRVYAYQALVAGLAPPASVKALTFVQHSLSVGYGPRCDCWRVEVYATQRSADAPGGYGLPRYLVPDFGATVSLTGFGAFGT